MVFNIIYQDDQLMVIDKRAGLVVTPSQTQHEVTLSEILTKDYGVKGERGGVVHRLDKDTSGILIAAQDQDTFDNLQAQFKSRAVSKTYLTLVHGFVKEAGVVEKALARNPGNREKFTVAKEGREAVTEYNPEGKFQITNNKFQIIFNGLNKIQMRKMERMKYNEFTLLKCHPLTGRTHQIRVHLKYIGHPVVADDKYGGRKILRLDHRWCKRQFLHAYQIEFNHPATGERVKFESPLPEDLKEALELLEEIEN